MKTAESRELTFRNGNCEVVYKRYTGQTTSKQLTVVVNAQSIRISSIVDVAAMIETIKEAEAVWRED